MMMFLRLLRMAQFHGARRIADEKRLRWLWIAAMGIIFSCSITVVCLTVKRFLSNPTFIVQLESYSRTMPFPSVFFCPEIRFRDEKIEEFLSKMVLPPGQNATYYKKVIRQLAAFYSPDVEYKLADLENIEHLLTFNGLSVHIAGRRLTTTCEETLFRCRWNSLFVNCSSLFHMELTGAGYCCVFNGQSLKRKYIIQDELQTSSENQMFSKIQGYSSGLMLVINQTQKLDNIDLSYKWLALQSGQHFIETLVNGTPLNTGTEQWAAYHFRGFQIAETARNLKANIRQCRLAEEPLNIFPLYHKTYCMLECEMMRTINKCQCVRSAHPRLYGVSHCKARNLKCVKHTMVSFDAAECNCPQACNIAMDFVKFTSFKLWQNVKSYDSFYDDLDFSKVTIVRAYIQNRQTKINSRWSYFGPLDLFSQLGGVFSLFFGFSIMTILELIQLGYHGVKFWISNRKVYKSKQILPLDKESKNSAFLYRK